MLQPRRWSFVASLVSSAIIFASTGCAPAVVVDVAEFNGRVTDAGGGVPGATVAITSLRDATPLATLTTGPNGTFSHAEQSHLTVYIVGGDPALQQYTVTAKQAERISPARNVDASLRMWWALSEKVSNGLGDLQLH